MTSLRGGILSMAAGVGAIASIVLPLRSARADVSAYDGTELKVYSKYRQLDTTWYFFKNRALAATYEEKTQAYNEAGIQPPQTFGPDYKFGQANDGSIFAKGWKLLISSVPAPGTTAAVADAMGGSTISIGSVFNTYDAVFAAHAQVNSATLPQNGLGFAEASVADPQAMILPVVNGGSVTLSNNQGSLTVTPSASATFEMRGLVNMGGSSISFDSHRGTGELKWTYGIRSLYNDGVFTPLFEYDGFYNNNTLGFTSTLTVHPDASIYLNDFTTTAPADPSTHTQLGSLYAPLEYNPVTLVTPAQLKAYLDSFGGPGGWLPTVGNILLGINFPIPNDAPGNVAEAISAGDAENRYFDIESDVDARVTAVGATVPEPVFLALGALGFVGLIRRR